MMKTIALTLCALVIGGVMGCPAARAQILQEETTVLADSTRLEQIVAPIALYPDSLLMQVLMAATYPVEVVEAERFARENAGCRPRPRRPRSRPATGIRASRRSSAIPTSSR